MKKLTLSLAVILATACSVYAADEISEDTVNGIMAKLEEMKCQMDPDDIEVEEDGYELDDVICEGGNQFDIELDKDLNETGRRAE